MSLPKPEKPNLDNSCHAIRKRMSTSEMMEKAYDILRELTIGELEACINRAPYEFSSAFVSGEYEEYRDAFHAECLFVYQCWETVRRKQLGRW